jgi:hypothetical protein
VQIAFFIDIRARFRITANWDICILALLLTEIHLYSRIDPETGKRLGFGGFVSDRGI